MAHCIALIGPAGSGKTTLADALAGLAGAKPAPASAVELRVVAFDWLEEHWTLLDCPGAPELIGLSRDALLAADMAVIVVPPDPDAAPLVAPWLRVVEDAGVPALLFINKADAPQGRLSEIVASLQAYARHPLILRQMPIREGDRIVGAVDLVSERAWRWRDGQQSQLIAMPADIAEAEHERHEALLEKLSEFDDWLLEEIIENREPPSETVYALCSRLISENRAIEALFGAAAKPSGLRRLLKALRHEAPGIDALRERLGGATAVAFGARRRKHLGRMVLLRALAPGIAQGSKLAGGTLGALIDPETERPGGVGDIAPGAVALAAKADHLPPRGGLTADGATPAPAAARLLPAQEERIVAAVNERDETKLGGALAALAEEDSGFSIAHDVEGHGRRIGIQGPLHLRGIEAHLSEIYGLAVEIHPVSPPWRETIAKTAEVHHRHRKQTGGAGQFADVRLVVGPAPRGAGFVFDEVVKGGAVPRNYIPAVEHGAREAMAKGPLGFPVVDVMVTLTDGQHHSVDSSDFAFRAAGRAGVQEALAQAAPVLLQPIHRVEIHAPSIFTGALSALVAGLKGQVLGFDRDGEVTGWDLFRALMPAAALPDLAPQLRAATQGTGRFEHQFDHYEEVYGKEAERISREHAAAD